MLFLSLIDILVPLCRNLCDYTVLFALKMSLFELNLEWAMIYWRKNKAQ